MVTAQQIRAARGLVGMSQREVAAAAGLSLPTVQRMESDPGSALVRNLNAVVAVLEAVGVEFLRDAGEGPGVRLRSGQRYR